MQLIWPHIYNGREAVNKDAKIQIYCCDDLNENEKGGVFTQRHSMLSMNVATQFDFNSVYEGHPHFYGTAPALTLQRMLGTYPISSGLALDLGAGQGRDSLFLAQSGFQVTAVDQSAVSSAFLQTIAAEQHMSIDCITQNVMDFDFPVGTYQLVNATTLLDHLTQQEIPVVAERIMRCLAPQGYAHLMVFTQRDPGYQVRIAHDEELRTQMSNTADAVEHYFADADELRELFHAMDVLECQEFSYEDTSHGSPHMHSVAFIIFKNPAHS